MMTDQHLATKQDVHLLIVRIDNGTGEKSLCSLDRAEELIRKHYENADGVLRQLAFGHPVRCTFATYQHRDFVEGWERPDPEVN